MLDKVGNFFQFSDHVVKSVEIPKKLADFIDFFNFSCGFLGLHNLIKDYSLKGRKISTVYDNFPAWQQSLFEKADFLGNLSFVLSGIRSKPSAMAWKWATQQLFSCATLELCLRNKSLFSIERFDRTLLATSFILGLPSTLKTIYCLHNWFSSSLIQVKENDNDLKKENECKTYCYTKAIRPTDVAITIQSLSITAHGILNHTPHK